MKNNIILRTSFIALFAAIICIGGFLRIPLGPVPIVLQNILCLLTASLLGGFWGALPTLLFFIAGVIGLPVFSGGTGGIAIVAGPTGGFIIGYVFASLVTSIISGKPLIQEKKLSLKKIIFVVLAFLVGVVVIYVFGVIHFARWATLGAKVPEGTSVLSYTMAACVLPFLAGDALKMILSILISIKVRPIVAQYLK